MKRLVSSGLALVLSAALAPAQDRHLHFTDPVPPHRDVLNRLNLVEGWRTHVPTRGRGDGIATVQLVGRDLIVQTRSSVITLIDAETGVTRWRTHVGLPFQTMYPVAFNNRSVYAINSANLYSLERDTGRVRWRFKVKGGVSAAPIADDNFVYLSAPDGRLNTYFLPQQRYEAPAPLPEPKPEGPSKPKPLEPPPSDMKSPTLPRGGRVGENRNYGLYETNRRTTGAISSHLGSIFEQGEQEVKGPQPKLINQTMTYLRLEWTPLQTPEEVLVVGPDGVFADYGKKPRENGVIPELFRVDIGTRITGQPDQMGTVAYVGGQDGNAYAVDMRQGRVIWRHIGGSPIVGRPFSTVKDVYVTSRDGGLARLDRATGDPMWRLPRGNQVLESNPDAEQFLAANPKFVYALDRRGHLLVLDQRRGRTLSSYDVRDFVVPIPNEETDRLYLGANNGLIVCLHDREYRQPVAHRQVEDRAAAQLRYQLNLTISQPPLAKQPLQQYLNYVRRQYGIKIDLNEGALVDADLNPDEIRKFVVQPPEVTNVPLGEMLKGVLDQVKVKGKLDLVIRANTLVIEPVAQKKKP